ncbi:unnamed protein product [Prunus armeniaca]
MAPTTLYSPKSLLCLLWAEGNMGYLTSTILELAPDAVTYEMWVMENAIVKSWLIGAMKPSMMNLFIYLPIAKNI